MNTTTRKVALRWMLGGLMLVAMGGCASSEEQADQKKAEPKRANPDVDFPMQASLVPDVEGVRTIQLYGGNDQENLPVIRLRQRDPLHLKFDLLGRNARPLSIYFYHANRSWERDLASVEYMKSYRREELIDYESSRSTQQPYVHYEYTFPDDDIGFEISGNYVLRVTEQGDESDVLFERSFFITEQRAAADFQLRRRRLGTNALPGFQPILLFEPPGNLQSSNIFAYNTCFVPNGRFSEARCVSRPQSLQQNALRFDLDPRQSFQVEGASYGLDLRRISVGGSVLEVDKGATPPKVWLEEDDVRFPGTSLAAALTGQTVLASGGIDEDLFGEYVHAQFRFVPPQQRPLRRDVYLAGSFNGWRPTSEHKLSWNAGERRYEGTVLLKQGQYAYRYVSRDPTLQRVLRETVPQMRNRFTALIYYHDTAKRTDRLLSVNQRLAP